MLKFEDRLPGGGATDNRDPEEEVRKLLGYAVDDEDLPLAEEVDEPGAEVWHIAPEASHVDSFRFLDADQAEIHVKFKPKGNQPLSSYKYTFAPGQRDHARVIWEEMAAANHPGIVIWEWLIRGGVPYQRVG